jgi:DNA-binding MarR family transcriptional regulator
MDLNRKDALADLAEAVLTVARELQTRPGAGTGAVRLTPTEALVMRVVDRAPGSSAGDVARAAGLQRSNLSPVLRSLEQSGLIERHPSAGERTVQISPAPAAAVHLAQVRDEWAAVLDSVLGDDSPIPALEILRRIEAGLVRTRSGSEGETAL